MARDKFFWTPARIDALWKATGATTRAEFAAMLRVSPQLMSHWLNGDRRPAPIHQLVLDCLAERHGLPASGKSQ